MTFDKQTIRKLVTHDVSLSPKEYNQACLIFAKDTQSRLVIDDQYHYFTNADLYTNRIIWSEGYELPALSLDCSWAFQQTSDTIDRDSLDHYASYINEQVDVAFNNNWYSDYQIIEDCMEVFDHGVAIKSFIGDDQELFETITLYPSHPDGQTYFVEISQLKSTFHHLDWTTFGWNNMGKPVVIFQGNTDSWNILSYAGE